MTVIGILAFQEALGRGVKKIKCTKMLEENSTDNERMKPAAADSRTYRQSL